MGLQILWLFVLAIPIACITWTITHEEVFREPRDFFASKCKDCQRWYQRKFFYLFTCEYCFSHYITLFFVIITDYHLLLDGWRGSLIGFFALVWIANQYMSLYNRIRLDIKRERVEIDVKDKDLPDSTA
ncbi:MAG: hypothetical protein WKF30_18580 [Pyrinomonadaceae bacterium]